MKKFDRHMERSRNIDFFIVFRSRKKTERAMAELQCLGFFVAIMPRVPGWVCCASKPMVPRYPALMGARRVLEDLAWRFDGVYDGWGTTLLEDE